MMSRLRPLLLAAVLLVPGALNPPTITSVAPATPTRGDRPQTLTISGTDFQNDLKLVVTLPGGEIRTFGGLDIQSRRDTSFQVSIALTASGTYSLVVLNPDGSRSQPFALQVQSSAPRPTIDQVTPAEVTKDTRAQVITLDGSNFADGLTLTMSDPAGVVTKVTTFDKVSARSIVVRLVFEVAGTYSLTVTNPGGETSNEVSVKVN